MKSGRDRRAKPRTPKEIQPENQKARSTPSPRRTILWLAPLLAGATLAAYYPAWHGGMLWDDSAHITAPGLRSAEGLGRIWFDLGATQQYYPVVHSTFWILHRLFGDNTMGYHLVNILLHALAAFLIALLLRKLAVPGAWLAAMIFALHPVQVESVAWISELKNTLSGVLYLGAALAYLKFDETRQGRSYGLALALFVLSLLSKSVTATLPAALLVVFWWQRGRLTARRDVLPLIPFFIAGAASGLLTVWVERVLIGAQGYAFQFSFLERGLIAGRVFWFYLAKLVWPANLIFIYPRWQVSQSVWWQYFYPLAGIGLLAGLWRMRKRFRGPLAAMLLFGGTLFPVLGFFNVWPFVFSFVADHFQYLAAIGFIALFSASVAALARRWNLQAGAVRAGYLLFAGLLGFLTWNQSLQYADAETLYQVTIQRNPTCWMAYNNLSVLRLHGPHGATPEQLEEALTYARESLRIKPDNAEAHNSLGSALQGLGRTEEAVAEYEEAIRLWPRFAVAHNNLGVALEALGRFEEAESQYRETLKIHPDSMAAHRNLGDLLQKQGRSEEAVKHMRAAMRNQQDSPEAYNSLGNALQRAGRLPEAAAQYEAALQLEPRYAGAHTNLGLVLERMGRLEEALAEHKEALRLEPDLAEAHYNLAGTLVAMGRPAEAAAECREALRLDPGYAEVHDRLGNALMALGQAQEAVLEYRAYLELRPESAEGHNDLGQALLGMRLLNEARVHFEAAVRLQPDFAHARFNFGNVLLALQHPEEAVVQYQMAIKIQPDSAEIHNNLGIALEQLGRTSEAISHFKEALHLKPDYEQARANLTGAERIHGPGK